jgi:hypothetical protein
MKRKEEEEKRSEDNKRQKKTAKKTDRLPCSAAAAFPSVCPAPLSRLSRA